MPICLRFMTTACTEMLQIIMLLLLELITETKKLFSDGIIIIIWIFKISASILLESRIQPDQTYQKQQVHALIICFIGFS